MVDWVDLSRVGWLYRDRRDKGKEWQRVFEV